MAIDRKEPSDTGQPAGLSGQPTGLSEKLAGLSGKLGLSKQTLIFGAGLLGILLLAFAKVPGTAAKAVSAQPDQSQSTASADYAKQLEDRLEAILASMVGVGRVDVLVTLESGYGYEYAKENKVNSDRLADLKSEEAQKTQEKNTTEESYVMVDAGGGSKSPLILKELEPQVKGVVVVCDGGRDPVTVAAVIDTVRVAANVSTAQISVSRMGQGLP